MVLLGLPFLVLLFLQLAHGQPPPAGADFYSLGLTALEQGDWAAAQQRFADAIDADEDNDAYYQARAVARILGEKPDQAIKDLDRALRIGGDDWESKLWLSAAYFMSNQPAEGARNLQHGPAEAREYAELVNTMARTYKDSRYRGGYFDKELNRRVEARGPHKKDFAKAASAYVRRRRTGREAAASTLVTAKSHLEARRFAEARRDAELLLQAKPGDLELLRLHADACLESGDLRTARREYTLLLIADTNDGEAYAQRARAVAGMGDFERASKNLELAARAGSGGEARAAELIRAGLLRQQSPAAEPAETLLEQLLEQARTSGSQAGLISHAERLVRAMNARRLRADETYQDRLRELLAATRTIPTSADSLAALGGFLYREATGIRGEAVEPRCAFTTYRASSPESIAAEVTRAEHSLDTALGIDPHHVQALTYRAGCLINAAAAATRGTAQGFYLEGVIALKRRDPQAARAAFEQSAQLDPQKIETHDQLASVYSALNMTHEAYEQQSAANNLVHTTAGPMLRLAWIETSRTARKNAREAVQRAAELDPADPRCAAYRGVISLDAEKYDEAAAYFRAALALLQARAWEHGSALFAEAPHPPLAGAPDRAPPGAPAQAGAIENDALGLGCSLQMRFAHAHEQAGRAEAALDCYRAIAALEARITDEQLRRPNAAALLPDPSGDQSRLPSAPPPIQMLADAHAALGNAALASKQLDEAEQHFDAVRNYAANWPATLPGRECLFAAASWARLGHVKVLAARGEYDQAFRLLTHEGWPGNMPKSFVEEARRLQDELAQRRQDGR